MISYCIQALSTKQHSKPIGCYSSMFTSIFISLWYLRLLIPPSFYFYFFFSLPCTSVENLDEVDNRHIIETEFGTSWNHDAMIFSVTVTDLSFKNNFLYFQYLIFCCHLRGNVSVLSKKQTLSLNNNNTYHISSAYCIWCVCGCVCGEYVCVDITFYTFKNHSYVNTLILASFFPFRRWKN